MDRGTLKFGFYLADNITELGRVYSALGDNVQAFGCLNRALDIAKKLPQRDLLANVLNSTGVLYLEQEDYEKASEYLRQSLQIYQDLNNQTESARILLNLGVTDQRRDNFDQALESFRKSLNQAEAASDKDLMMAAGEGMGVVYREKRDYAAALGVLDRSLSLAEEVGDRTRIAEILWRKADLILSVDGFIEHLFNGADASTLVVGERGGISLKENLHGSGECQLRWDIGSILRDRARGPQHDKGC